MNNRWNLDAFESLYPYVLASITPDEKSKQTILLFGELCEKHGISFKKFMLVLQEFNQKSEANN